MYLGAASTARNILAAVGLATSNSNIGPGPVGARSVTAFNNNIISVGVNSISSGDVLNGEVSDRDTSGRGAAVEVTAIIVLLDENSVAAIIISVCIE